MASPVSTGAPSDDVLSEREEDVPTSQPSSLSIEAHNAAAAVNASKKAITADKKSGKRKLDRILLTPEKTSVSELQVSYADAKKKRGDAKKEAKLESAKVRAARKRVDRLKAKAKELSNNDLYQVYIMRMQADEKRKAAELVSKAKGDAK